MANNKLLVIYSEKLGIQNPPTLQKAETYLRVLNSKGAASTMSDTVKAILCLDLAASTIGVKFDKITATKLSALSKGTYQNHLNNIEKMLNLDKPLTVSELCVQLSCSEAKEIAENILRSYQESDKKIKDITHPQYAAAAVYATCKINGIKVDKSHFRRISRLKTAQWSELAEEFVKFAESLGLSSKKNHKKRIDQVEEAAELKDDSLSNLKKDEENIVEDYEVWRDRILQEATEEILKSELEA